MKRLLLFLLITLIGITSKGSTKIGELYYNLDSSNKTAEITYRSFVAASNKDYVSGEIIIEESIVYNSTYYRVIGISNKAFVGCVNLTSITIPNSVTSIGTSVFEGCSGLTSVTIPNSVTSIGTSVFEGCSGLTSVTIPNSVTSIGDSAFADCSGLTSITIPNSVISIGESAFDNCYSIKEVILEDGEVDINLGYSYQYSYRFPLFFNCKLESVYLGRNTIYSIAPFSKNEYLKEVTIGNSVTFIGENAFLNCKAISKFNISTSVISIEEQAFSGCSSLSTLDIPTSVTFIGKNAFYDCPQLSIVELPSSVISVKDKAFANCINLNELTICSSIPEFSSNAFSGCTNLSKITLKEEVGTLGSVIFPSSVRFVTSLNSTPPTITNTTFNSETTQNGFLFVPNKDITTYQYSPYWCDFLRIESVPSSGIGDSNDQNSENIFNTKIDKYIYMGLDEEFSFTDLLPSGSSASSWESSSMLQIKFLKTLTQF